MARRRFAGLGSYPLASGCCEQVHTLIDVRGPIPTMIAISWGNQADVKILDELIPEPGAFYVRDRGYVDFARLYRFYRRGGTCPYPVHGKVRGSMNTLWDHEPRVEELGSAPIRDIRG